MLFLLVVMGISAIVLIYPPLRLLNLLGAENIPWWSPLALFATPLALRSLHERFNNGWTRRLTAIIMTWLGVCFISLCALVVAELVLLINFFTPQSVGACAGVFTLLVSLYSFVNAQRLHTQVVSITNQPTLRNVSLVQISDVHVGSRQPGFLKPIVQRINAINPTYTMITGDLIDMRGITTEHLACLGDINSPTYFCIGNHERYVDLNDICDRLRSLGIHVLRNECVEDGEFQFIGIDDAEIKSQVSHEIVKLKPAENLYKVLLYHRPDDAEAASAWGVNLMLTGHTHRGQIFPFNFLVKRVFPRLYKSYQVGAMQLYVSPGTGTWGPIMRLGSRCEITHFTFQ